MTSRVWLFSDNRSVLLLDGRSPVSLDFPGITGRLRHRLFRIPCDRRREDEIVGPESEVFSVLLGPDDVSAIASISGTLVPVGRRGLAAVLPHDLYHESNLAFHYAYWNSMTRFCGWCGTIMEFNALEGAKTCPSCGRHSYPVISPAVIMAVVRDGRLLMAHGTNRPGKTYSVLAGFVEPGENLEQCVAREVFEEVGIEIRNIRYFASQSWAFPTSLMVGFTAEWSRGELKPDPDEIEDAGWYAPGDLPPEIPGNISISRKLIEWFVSEYGTREDLRELAGRP